MVLDHRLGAGLGRRLRQVGIIGTPDQLTVQNWYSGTAYRTALQPVIAANWQ